jgi:hypothetical protein
MDVVAINTSKNTKYNLTSPSRQAILQRIRRENIKDAIKKSLPILVLEQA